MDIISDKKVKIRKPHQCFACMRKFEAGTIMQAQTNNYDGSIGTAYSCLTCDNLIKQFKHLFFDTSEYIFPMECVSGSLSSYQVSNPEQLLEKLILEKESIYQKGK